MHVVKCCAVYFERWQDFHVTVGNGKAYLRMNHFAGLTRQFRFSIRLVFSPLLCASLCVYEKI
jgi:hypothetical protein